MDEITTFLNQLVEKAEDARLRLRSGLNIETLMREICGMLNGEGGWIVVGIGEDRKTVGIADVDAAVSQIRKSVAEEIYPASLIFVNKSCKDDKDCILVSVMAGVNKPYSYKGVYWTMVDDTTLRADAGMIAAMHGQTAAGKRRWETEVNQSAGVKSLNEGLLKSVVDEGVKSGRVNMRFAKSPTEYLSYVQLRDYELLRNGAVALFAERTDMVLPQCRVRIRKMMRGKTAEEWNTRDISGNLFELHDKLMGFYNEELSVDMVLDGGNGRNERRYVMPRSVFDEMVTNALIHADYSDFWNSVTLSVYPDRVECVNPGRMPESVLSDLKNEHHLSAPHNPVMANVFYAAGLMELAGRGIDLINREMIKMGCKEPNWDVKEDNTVLTIYTVPKRTALNERVKAFYDGHEIGYTFVRSEYQELFGIPERTAKYDLKLMVDSGLAVTHGIGKAVRYELVAK